MDGRWNLSGWLVFYVYDGELRLRRAKDGPAAGREAGEVALLGATVLAEGPSADLAEYLQHFKQKGR